MNSKKRRRKNVLNENSTSIQNNGISSSSLIHLVEQYNSDSDEDEPVSDTRQGLDAKVNDFFKEIQYITEQSKESSTSSVNNNAKSSELSSTSDRVPSSLWQECYDESTGYPYYWHVETNEVTWEIPKELKELRASCKYQDKSEDNAKTKTFNVSRSNKPADSQTNNNPTNETAKGNISRNKYKPKCDPGHSTKKVPKKKTKSKDKPEEKSDDSNDGCIEMITSFGDENSDSDRSDDEKINDESQVNSSSKKVDSCESRNQDWPNSNIYDKGVDDSKNEYQIKSEKSSSSLQRISNYPLTNNKSQEESTVDYKNEGKLWCISGYTDNSDSDDNLNSKKPTASTLFPASFYKSQIDDHDLKAEKNTEQSEYPSASAEFSNNDESTQIFNKNNEMPKINRTLENLGTSIKGFQRKRRIAFDVLTNSRGNDERLGFGFSKKSSIDNDSNKDTTSTASFEEKKRSFSKYSIDFIKGETIEVKNEISKTENYIFTHQVQIIVEKLKILCEKSSEIPTAQVINIQLQTLLNAWESGDLNDSYFFNWLNDTKKIISQLEEAAAPPEWNYIWDKDTKKYYYKNKTSEEIQWTYPDIIGGAEEMEICTTPPAASSPVHQDEIKTLEPDVFEIIQSNLEQSSSAKLLNEKSGANVSNQNPTQENDNSGDKHDKIQTETENIESGEVKAPLPPQISIPSPPPPPRIYANDLKKNNKSSNESQTKAATTNINKDKTINSIDESEKKNIISIVESTSTSCETLLPLTNTHLSVANTSPHIEPLPPGVDQTESPYAIAAATIESPVIFSTNPQSNASIYAATIPNPTNISIIGHHPALVHNQIVHYPAVYQHLHDQAIIAAANRFTSPEAVQLMLHHPGIYANTQVISKPPINMKKESLGSAVDSFYNDIASIESQAAANDKQEVKNIQTPTMLQPTTHQEPQPAAPIKTDSQTFLSSPTADLKEKKKKKVKIVINKKHKEVSSMVAKWKKAQNFQDSN